MNHGAQFKVGNVTKHSMDDWGLLLAPFDIPTAKVKTSYIDLEGANGSIDDTEAFGITYEDLSFSIKFTLPKCDYNAKLREIKSFLHGKVVQITMYNDTDYYYLGRCNVDDFKQSKAMGTITIDVVAIPFKLKQSVTIVNETISGTKDVTFRNGQMPVVPSFECSSEMQLTFNGNTYSIGTTKTKVANIIFEDGDNVITFNGLGTVKVTYQQGVL